VVEIEMDLRKIRVRFRFICCWEELCTKNCSRHEFSNLSQVSPAQYKDIVTTYLGVNCLPAPRISV